MKNREANQRWTRDNLTRDDYAFAISDTSKPWHCMADKLGKCDPFLAVQMLIWEIWREVLDCREFSSDAGRGHYDALPFLSVKENLSRVTATLESEAKPRFKPAELPPLAEIDLQTLRGAKTQIQDLSAGMRTADRLLAETFSIHAFHICRLEPTEMVVERFRKWIVKYRRETPEPKWLQYARKGDIRFREGNKHVAERLCALAVHRLKQAGYGRAEVEKKLKIKLYTLDPGLEKKKSGTKSGTNHWNKSSKIVERLLDQLIVSKGYAFGVAPPFPFQND